MIWWYYNIINNHINKIELYYEQSNKIDENGNHNEKFKFELITQEIIENYDWNFMLWHLWHNIKSTLVILNFERKIYKTSMGVLDWRYPI